tara:strand:+ start:773 stop:1054 length:282 start_codon:yes stop_codon:yes gene_type:complete
MSKDKDIKFDNDEMKELKEIQDGYLEVQNNLGQAKVSLIRLEQQRDNLLQYEETLRTNFFELQEKEKEFIQKVTDKYGDGELNPNTGTFTPQK